MILLKYEWQKLVSYRIIWGFLALCLAFNGLLLYNERWSAAEFNNNFYTEPIIQATNQFLYNCFFKALLLEGLLLAVLVVLCLLEHEKSNHTDVIWAATRTGRSLWGVKAIAGACLATVFYLLLILVSFAVYFAVWDWQNVWTGNLASHSNIVFEPALSWQHLLVVIGLGAGLIVIYSLLTALCGICFGNIYAAILLLLVASLAGWTLWSYCFLHKLWIGFVIASFLPVSLFNQPLAWFDNNSTIFIIPWQETYVVCSWLIISGLGCVWALWRFSKQDFH